MLPPYLLMSGSNYCHIQNLHFSNGHISAIIMYFSVNLFQFQLETVLLNLFDLGSSVCQVM